MRGDKTPSQDSVVQVSTDLPPQVDGQLRCFCKLNISKIVWSIPKSPNVTLVRVKWWGEDGLGTIFRPVDTRKGKSSEIRTTARYPVRSGPIQFATYLKDMSSLCLEVIDSPKSNPIGQATVPGLSQLTTSKGIQRKFPVVSNTGQKIADLEVCLVLEQLMASYDCNGSIPTSDLNTKGQQESYTPHLSSAHHPNNSSSKASMSANGYTGDNRMMGHSQGNHSDAVAITASGDVVSLPINGGGGGQRIAGNCNIGSLNHVAQPANTGGGGGDLLSMLVDRGKVLRDAMAVSAMNADTNPKHSSSPSHEFVMNPSLMSSSPATKMDSSLLANSAPPSPSKAAMNMLLGSPPVQKQDFQLYKFVTEGSPGSSLSSDFGLDQGMSELEDPNHDHSLLQDLFYNESDIDAVQVGGDIMPFHNYLHQQRPGLYPTGHLNIPSSALDFQTIPPPSVAVNDPGNQRPPSRASSLASLNMEDSEGETTAGKKKKVKRKARSRSRSNSTSRSRSRSVTPSSRPSQMKSRKDEAAGNLSLASSSKDKSAISGSSNLHKPKKKVVKARSSRAKERLVAGKKKSKSRSRERGDLISASDASFMSDSLSQRSDVDGLSVERLTLLGRAQVARVNVEILNLNKSNVWDLSSFFSDHLPTSRSKKSSKLKKPCAFFVEYQFPIVASSKDKYTPNAVATEVTRVASRNIKNGAVSFGHRSMYPVLFDGSMLERWWKSALVFRLFAREAGQNSPCLIGSGGISLKSILKSDNLFMKREIEIPDSNHDGLLNSSRSSINTTLNSHRSSRSGVTIIGHLKISVELASDQKDFATVLARTKLSEMSGNTKMVSMGGAQRDKARLVKQLNMNKDTPLVKSPLKKIDLAFDQPEIASQTNNANSIVGRPPQSPRRKCAGSDQAALTGPQEMEIRWDKEEDDNDEIGMLKRQLKGLIGNMSVTPVQSGAQESSAAQAVEAPTLHCLLYIEEGRNLSVNGIPPLHMANQQPALMQRPMDGNRTVSRNSYLACRMFWCNDILHSQVCWNSLNPEFNFLQVSPVSLNTSLLERMKENYMIVEVWDKQAASTSDKLIGLVKLSLHQFYLSFRDRKIGNALLKSQYPVMSIDNYMPIIDLFSGLYFGQLKVVLALGSQQQISMLQQAVVSGKMASSNSPRQNGVSQVLPAQGQVDHHFDVVVEGVRGLKVFEKMIWGEADCFVQFYFPSQAEGRENGQGIDAKSLTRMKCFRTATTLCIPDPVFHDSTQIKLTLPVGKPVQPELLIACSNPGEQGKGIPFEVWCRYYHPNVRDQRIAQGILPIAKLCAMVTMHRPSQPCVQSFPIHLSQVATHDAQRDLAQGKNTGLMDVAIRYSSQTAQGESATTPRNLHNSQVLITVEIIRAAGLKAAAECVAQSDASMAYCADVGVNSYIRVTVPFLGKENEKMTRTVAKSFIPEFGQCLEFPCDLTLSNHATSSHTRSLAELLEGADAIFEIWHQTSGQSYHDTRIEDEMCVAANSMRSGGDVLLGSCHVPLVSLLTQSAGVHGWFPITQPQLSWTKPHKDGQLTPKNQVMGGIELSLRFSDVSDREKVVSVGRGLGWSPLHDMDSLLNSQWDEGSNRSTHKVAISIELASFPLMSAVKAGHSDLDPSSLCYVCYTLFDQGVTVSKSRKIHNSESGALQSHIADKNEFFLPQCADLQRYLQEKRLEIQVWVTYSDGNKSEQRPRKGDRLIGSCYIELGSLLDKRKKRQQISGSFPMFNGNSPSLKSAFIRANIMSVMQQNSSQSQLSDMDGSVLDTDQMSDSDSTLTLQGDICVEKSPKQRKKSRKSGDVEASFSVVLALDRAMHLPMVAERNRSSEVRPTTYVSYQSAERSKQSCTSIFPNSCNPVWDYAVETRLSNEYLHKKNKNLVLKVWHKPSDASKSPDKSSDRVLGFVSVDLSPLAKGLNQLCGWYNIIEFTGQCRGQIKVSITPQDLQTAGGATDSNTSAFGLSALPTPALSLANTTTQSATSTIAHQLLQLQQHVMSRMGSLSKNLGDESTTSTNNNHHYFDTSEDMTTTGTLSSNHPTPRPYHHNHHTPFSNRTEPESTPREDSSKSFLFSTLRRQMADLDKVMENFKGRTGEVSATARTTTNQENRGKIHHVLQDGDNEKSGDIIYGSHSELSTIRTASSLMNTRESSAPSRINNNSSSDVITSQELQQNNDNGINIEVPPVVSGKGSSMPKLSDSGVFSAKNCVEDGGKSGEECLESGRTEKNIMMMTTSDNQSTLHSVFDGGIGNVINNNNPPNSVMEEVISVQTDMTEKTQPFVLNASNSETSSNSQGFALHRSCGNNNRCGVNGSPTKSDSTLQSGSVVNKNNGYVMNEVGSRSSGSKTHLEMLAGDVSDDESDTEEDKMFGSYHRYRDLLDAEEEDDEIEEDIRIEEEGGEDDGNDTVEIVPRNLNNMSQVLNVSNTNNNDRDKVIQSSVINNSSSPYVYNGNNIDAVESSGGVKDFGSPSEEASPSRVNVHEGTSVWYTEGSEEEEKEEAMEKKEKIRNTTVEEFQEVFDRNQRILRERRGVCGGDDDSYDEKDDDIGEWMMMEKEVLGNQNVEEWLVHRSHETDNNSDNDEGWLRYRVSNTDNDEGGSRVRDGVQGIQSNGLNSVGNYSDAERKQDNGEEMKLFLDEVSDYEGKGKDLNSDSSDDEDTVRNEEDSRQNNNTEVDSFFNVEPEEREAINGLENLKIQDSDSIEMLHQQSEALLQSLEQDEANYNSSMTVNDDIQFNVLPRNGTTTSGHGARPKIRHMLSNVELDSETSNSESRRNSKGSGASNASRNGTHAQQTLELQSPDERVIESSFTHANNDNDNLKKMNGIDNDNEAFGNSLPLSKDGSEIEMVMKRNGVEDLYEEKEEREVIATRKGVNDRNNSTMDSAFVDGECSEGHTTGVNSSAVSGRHSSYIEDSCLDPSNASSVLGHQGLQGHSSMISNGGGNCNNDDVGIPNFFMNTKELQGSISALQKATAAANSVTKKDAKQQNKVKAVSELVHKIADNQSKSRSASALAKAKPPPSTDHAKRIAKIFSSKP